MTRNMRGAAPFPTTKEHLRAGLKQAMEDGSILEFGVYKGGSIRFIANNVKGKTIHGFDSFEGLPKPWAAWVSVGDNFDLRGNLPKVPKNVRLYPGWFDETLPKFLEENNEHVSFLNIDCDLYSSTKQIFDLLYPRIVPGTIINFDEYFNIPNWEDGEFKAFQEFVEQHAVKYEYIGFALTQVSVRILEIKK